MCAHGGRDRLYHTIYSFHIATELSRVLQYEWNLERGKITSMLSVIYVVEIDSMRMR